MISIRDIAKECGVSVATVSKALNGHHDISAQTRETVCRKAAEMGYQPNSAARALKTNRTYNLGVLYEDPQHSGLGHEYFSRILESFRAQAEACGYDVTFINRNVGKRRSSYLEHCRYRGVDGVCVVCVNFLDPQVLELVQSELPVVTVDHMFNNRTSIVSDNVKGVGEPCVRYGAQEHCLHPRRTHGRHRKPLRQLLQDLLRPGAAGARRLCTRRRLPRLRQLRTHHRRAAGAAAAAHMHLFHR